MLPIHRIVWHEWRARGTPARVPEPLHTMDDPAQVRAYVQAYAWGGAVSALQLHHLRELSRLIRPGDTVIDLACGPGPLLLELAALYPDCRFIGIDLAPRMLATLLAQAKSRSLGNVEVLEEDIRHLPSLQGRKVDLVISTSALHHLPDLDSLRQVFTRIDALLAPDGGFYLFDFCQVRSPRARALLVADVARTAPAVTAEDYAHSLAAAFALDDLLGLSRRCLRRPHLRQSSRLFDFFCFLHTPPRSSPHPAVAAYTAAVWQRLPLPLRIESLMLRALRKRH